MPFLLEENLAGGTGTGTAAPPAPRARRHGRASGSPLRGAGARRSTPVWGLASGGLYLALALLAYWPVQPLSASRIVDCGCYDPAEQVWFLAWTPHAILHGLNPFFTTALNQPFGANLAANTTMPLLGLLASPITFTLGPIAAYNALLRLALFSSALSMYLVLRHYRLRPQVCLFGGLVYGFSPYVLAQGSLHLNLSFVPLLPIIVAVVDELVTGTRSSARRTGLWLGALATAQYLVSSELLVDLAVLVALVLVVTALRSPRQARARLRRVGTGIAWALAVFAVVAGYPLVFSLVGPEHVAGSPFVPGYVDLYRNDLLGPLVPTTRQLVAPSSLAALGNSLVPNGAQPGSGAALGGPGVENGAYLGLPLVAAWLVATLWATRRRQGRILAFALAALAAFVLSLGLHLQVHGHDTGVPLPFEAFASLPLLDFDVPARFTVFCDLGVVLAVAGALDAAWGHVAAWSARRRVGLRAGSALLGAAALVSLLPAGAEVSVAAGVPSFFSSASVRSIRTGDVVLAYPYPKNPQDQAMLWQVASGFRFSIVGGYVLNPFLTGSGAGGGYDPPTLDPGTVEVWFEQAYGGMASDPMPVAPWSKDRLKSFLVTYHIGDIVAESLGAEPRWVSSFLTGALHEQPVSSGGVEVWADVQHSRLVLPARRKRR